MIDVSNMDFAALEPLGEGDFSRAYLSADDVVVRIPRHEEAAASLAMEARLLAAIAGRLPLAVPRPEFHEADGDVAPAHAVHPRVPGVELTRTLWSSLPEPSRSEMPARVGAFLRALHQIDPAEADGAGLRVMDRSWIRTWVERTAPGADSPLPDALRADLHACFVRASEQVDDLAPAILHADLSPGHVLFDPEAGHITGIIDWGDAMIGDPARDFIFLYEDWGMDFLDLALAAYADAAVLPVLRRRVLVHYLADQLDWTLAVERAGHAGDFGGGLRSLESGVRDLDFASGPHAGYLRAFPLTATVISALPPPLFSLPGSVSPWRRPKPSCS